MSDAILAINARLGQDSAEKVKSFGVEAVMRASMRGVKDGNFMETRDEPMLRAAVAGALLAVGQNSNEGIQILKSWRAVQKVSALLSAVQAGLNASIDDSDEDLVGEVLPILKWWHEESEK